MPGQRSQHTQRRAKRRSDEETRSQASTPNGRLRHQVQCRDDAVPPRSACNAQLLQAWVAVAHAVAREDASNEDVPGVFWDNEGRHMALLPDLSFGDADAETSSQASYDPSEGRQSSSYDPSVAGSSRGSLASFDGLPGLDLDDVSSIRSERSYDAEHLHFTDSDDSDTEEGSMPRQITARLPQNDSTMVQVEVETIERLLKSEEASELELCRLHYQLLLYLPDSPSQRLKNCSFLTIHAACHDDSWVAAAGCDGDPLSPCEVREGEWEEQLNSAGEELRRQDEALQQLLFELRESVDRFRNSGGGDCTDKMGVTAERLGIGIHENRSGVDHPSSAVAAPAAPRLPPAGAGTPAPNQKVVVKPSATTRLQELKTLMELEKSLDAVLDAAS